MRHFALACFSLLGVTLALLGAQTAQATIVQTQGYRIHDVAGTDNGTRASLTGSATLNSDPGLAFASVVISNNAGNMIQVGEIKMSSTVTVDNCGHGNGVIIEREKDGNYTCTLKTGYTFGSNHMFKVLRVSGGGWHAYVDGGDIGGPYDINLPQGATAYAKARAEAEYSNSQSMPFDFTWGPSGYESWQFTTDNGSSWTQIGTSHGYQAPTNSGWHLEGTPSPFRIYR
jgi:hypothetical protein